MKVIFENNLSNSQIIEYIEKFTKDERKRSFLKDRIIKGAAYENLCYFQGLQMFTYNVILQKEPMPCLL